MAGPQGVVAGGRPPAGRAEKDLRGIEAEIRDRHRGELPPEGSDDRERWDELVRGARGIDEDDSIERIVDAPRDAKDEYLNWQEGQLEEREKGVHAQEKDVSAQLLSQRYEVPMAELEGFDDPRDMKLRGLELEREMRLAHESGGSEPEAEGVQN